ncbi:hypothetical protein Tco_0002648 [Tanacetum coccineum]
MNGLLLCLTEAFNSSYSCDSLSSFVNSGTFTESSSHLSKCLLASAVMVDEIRSDVKTLRTVWNLVEVAPLGFFSIFSRSFVRNDSH